MHILNRRSLLLAAGLTMTLASFAGPAQAQPAAIPGAGDRAPPVAGLDINGRAVRLEKLTGKQGNVLVFFRSASWCPYCKAQLIELNEKAAARLAEKGWSLVGLSYDSPEILAKFAAERSVRWPLISDQKSRVIDAWSLRDPQYPAGNRAHGVPRPAIFVIGKDGRIRARLMEDDFRKRPQVEAVMAAVEAASRQPGK